MADRAVNPWSKPDLRPPPPRSASLPPTKSQIKAASKSTSSSARRGLCRSCCLCSVALLALLILLAAIAVGIFYAVYRPHRPAFSIASLRVAALNVSAAGQLIASRIDLNVTVRNPNKKLVFLYDPISVSVVAASGSGVDVGDGTFEGFVQEARSTKILSATAASGRQQLEAAEAADLRKSTSLMVDVEMRTKAGVKIGNLKTKKIGIKVLCEGINAAVSRGKATAAAVSTGGDCKVKLRIKIGKWNI
ncbi:uncharacterized protein LOC141842927 [Curcuma longa]|uniref:uncharacterized protein LOC141842927 n=1 Tax=Curcuma longa TaxID=136217 RepID=UPI003D9E974C